MSVAYDGDIPGLSGVHYGGDGIGIPGWAAPATGTHGASIIRLAYPGLDESKEYRLVMEAATPGLVLNENGGGTFAGAVTFNARLFEDGIEL